MKLGDFFKDKSNLKYVNGIDRIKDDFIISGYERFLCRDLVTLRNDILKTDLKEINENNYIINNCVKKFLEQFSSVNDEGIIYIYPESYVPNYFMIRELSKCAKVNCILENLIPEDDTISHIVVLDSNDKRNIILMNHLVYSGILGDNFGGFKLLGIDIQYYLKFCGEDSFVYTLKEPNSLMHYQGYTARNEGNPYVIFNTRKNIEMLIKKGYFKTEFELYRNVKKTLMPFFQKMYLKAKTCEDSYNDIYFDWKIEKSKLKGDLIEKGIIKSKWKHEQSLFLLVKKEYPNAFFQYRPEWLSPQSIDIYIPEIELGIEYQGIQHYTEVKFFGGKEALKHRIALDEKKRNICKQNGIHLIEWNYNMDITKKNLRHMLKEYV